MNLIKEKNRLVSLLYVPHTTPHQRDNIRCEINKLTKRIRLLKGAQRNEK